MVGGGGVASSSSSSSSRRSSTRISSSSRVVAAGVVVVVGVAVAAVAVALAVATTCTNHTSINSRPTTLNIATNNLGAAKAASLWIGRYAGRRLQLRQRPVAWCRSWSLSERFAFEVPYKP